MKTLIAILLLVAADVEAEQPATVRVAAIQCSSVMGRPADNLAVMTKLIREAADGGAKIVVLPECSVQGYMDQTTWRAWSKTEDQTWPGRGHSCIISGNGNVLAMSESVTGSDIVMADLKIRKRQKQPANAAPRPKQREDWTR